VHQPQLNPEEGPGQAARVHRLVREAAGFGTHASAATLHWPAVIETPHAIMQGVPPAPERLEQAGVGAQMVS
jgi:hypothetical protein